MVFHIIDAMTDGFDRTRERNGLVFVAVFAVLALLNVLVTPTNLGPARETAPTLSLIDVVTGLLSFVIAIATLVAAIAALRTFASDERETIPREFIRRNIGLVTLNAIVGAIVFGLLVAVGSALLLVPGLFVLVSLYYWSVFVAVEDQNFVQAFRSSWELTSGSRLRLFGLGVAVVALALIINATVGVPAFLVGGIVGVALVQIASAVVTVYMPAPSSRSTCSRRPLEPTINFARSSTHQKPSRDRAPPERQHESVAVIRSDPVSRIFALSYRDFAV